MHSLIEEDQPTILLANGVNLDLLGQRQPDLYGHKSLETLVEHLQGISSSLAREAGFRDCRLVSFQSNCEATYLEKLSTPWDIAIINPGAWTHTSLAIADRLAGLGRPYIEVHLSNILSRESFRAHSYTAKSAVGCLMGMGALGYEIALTASLKYLKTGLS